MLSQLGPGSTARSGTHGEPTSLACPSSFPWAELHAGHLALVAVLSFLAAYLAFLV